MKINNMEYYDISKINQFKFDLYFERDNSLCYKYVSFRINNTNLNYSYFHHQDISWRSTYIFITDESKYVNEKDDYISLKENKNRIIYLLIWFQGCAYIEHIPILFTTSNYSTLYSLSNFENK